MYYNEMVILMMNTFKGFWIQILYHYDNGNHNNNNDTLKKHKGRQFWGVHLIFSSYCIVFDAEIRRIFVLDFQGVVS